MADADRMAIDEKVARVEEIITPLQEEDVSLGKAKTLREEGEELLAELEGELDGGEAEIIVE